MTADFTGEIQDEDSLSSRLNYARSIGYDMDESISAFTSGPGRAGKYKKKKKRGKAMDRMGDES